MQGAIGLAQLRKLDDMIQRQQRNQALIREALESIDGITMRAIPENGKDSYTHVGFFLPSAEKATAFHKRLSEKAWRPYTSGRTFGTISQLGTCARKEDRLEKHVSVCRSSVRR